MQMFEGVGRRSDRTEGQFLDIGQHTLNGYERDVLYRNDGRGGFVEVGWVNGVDRVEDGRALSVLDADADGRPDFILRNYRQPAELLVNGADAAALGPHWLGIRLVGTRSNRDAIGARLRLRTANGRQTREVAAGGGYLSGSTLVQLFGLGDATRVDELEVRWPSGARSVLHDLPADRRWTLVEGEDAPRERDVTTQARASR
jgi:hypothetical protein